MNSLPSLHKSEGSDFSGPVRRPWIYIITIFIQYTYAKVAAESDWQDIGFAVFAELRVRTAAFSFVDLA